MTNTITQKNSFGNDGKYEHEKMELADGLILVPIVSLLTQKTLPKNVDEKFSCYDATITTNVTTSLGEKN